MIVNTVIFLKLFVQYLYLQISMSIINSTFLFKKIQEKIYKKMMYEKAIYEKMVRTSTNFFSVCNRTTVRRPYVLMIFLQMLSLSLYTVYILNYIVLLFILIIHIVFILCFILCYSYCMI